MTKKNFYDFGVMMKNDSKILFDNRSFHNSVYIGAFVLESYIKILLIDKESQYTGHIGTSLINRLRSVSPETFSSTILVESSDSYPSNLLSPEYDINFRYEVNKWTEEAFCKNIQDEVLKVYNALNNFRIMGLI